MIFCPDGIIPDSGLTGLYNIYIYIYIYIYGGVNRVSQKAGLKFVLDDTIEVDR